MIRVFVTPLVLTLLTSSNVVGQKIDWVGGLSWSWVVVVKWVVRSSLLRVVLLRLRILVVALARLRLNVVVVSRLWVVLWLWLVLLRVVLWLGLVGGLRSNGCWCWWCLRDIISFGLETLLSCGVPDDLLLTRSINVSICSRNRSIRVSGFLSEASVISGVVAKFVVSLELSSDVYVVKRSGIVVSIVLRLWLNLVIHKGARKLKKLFSDEEIRKKK
ncbi:UNVERIFIED_CONTAM: hypothetical protein NCL1_04797 [Trichonephila clavipes]